jgi:hypothetical protein
MNKTFVAQNIVSVNPFHFKVEDGVVTGLVCNVEVNYGEMGLTHQIDLWADLTAPQKTMAQNLYNFIRAKATEHFLG